MEVGATQSNRATAKSAARTPSERKQVPTDRELALRLGALMLCGMSSGSGGAIRAIDESGLSFVQMKALLTVAGDDDGEPSPINLVAERLEISLPSASRAVDGLVKRGLATRVEDPTDRRVRRVSLTPEGREIADQLLSARLEGLEAFVSGLNAAEHRKLDAALELLIKRPEVAEAYRSHARRASR